LASNRILNKLAFFLLFFIAPENSLESVWFLKTFRKYPEFFILLAFILSCYFFLETQIDKSAFGSQGQLSSLDIIIISFFVSLIIAIVAVISGVGGGVIFTPLLLAFTSFDTLLIRSTGLVVAMFSGLISTGPLMKKGLSDIKLVMLGAIPIIFGGMSGSWLAIYLANNFGQKSDGIVRLSLGILLILIAIIFIINNGKSDYPKSKSLDLLASKLKLRKTYWEDSLSMNISYRASNVKLGIGLFLLIGFTGGFFGLGGGWAVVPLLNLLMSIPLKVATGTSGVLLAMGNSAAIWPYINAGALIGVIAAPWMLGQVIGGIIGANLLASLKASAVRGLLIAILLFSSVKLVVRGIETLFSIEIPII
tara:strand:+ start:2963 stop:4054 length:1092 start_codon:yes stop_codon:yes gene_type:complete